MFRKSQIEKSQEVRNSMAELVFYGLLTLTFIYLIFRGAKRLITWIVPNTRTAKVVKANESTASQTRTTSVIKLQRTRIATQSPEFPDSQQGAFDYFFETEHDSAGSSKKREKRVTTISHNTQQVLMAINNKKDRKKNAKLEKERQKESRLNQQLIVKPADDVNPTPEIKQPVKKVSTKSSSVSTQFDPAILTVHKNAILELYDYHKNERQPDDESIERITQLLAFGKIPATEYSDHSLCKDFLICARVGINIQSSIKLVCSDYFIDGLRKEDIATLVFACFLHDANIDTQDQIDSVIINKLLKRADMLFRQAAQFVGTQNFASEQIALSLFSNTNDKFENNTLKDTKFHRFMLDAATYYQFELTKTTLIYLRHFVKSNDQTTESPPQKALYKYLGHELSTHDVTVFMEEQTDIATYSADILIVDNQTNKMFDVEFDGRDHFYKNEDGKTTDQYKREYIARDKSLMQAGVAVIKFTSNDFSFSSASGHINRASEKLTSFIKEIKSQCSKNNTPPIPSEQDIQGLDDSKNKFKV